MAEPAISIRVKGQTMEYKVLSGPFNAGELERDLNGHAAEGWRNGHAAEGWRVVGMFQAISWMKSRTPTVIVLAREGLRMP
jgi:hypothetical protein